MVENGKGGGNTTTGIYFEERTDILKFLDKKIPGLEIKGNDIFYNNNLVGTSYKQHGLCKKFLKENNINYLDVISKELKPDEAIYIPKYKLFFIIEMKFQKVDGSVDEKLQTCYFKKWEYEKLLKPLGISVEYCYILNDWFRNPKYRDTLEYIKMMNCDYHFNELPADFIDRLIK